MNNKEIKEKIAQLNILIEQNIDPTTFVLNEAVIAYQKEIEDLQKQCSHKYEDNICIYCGKIKGQVEEND